MKLIIGADGQLGSDLCRVLDDHHPLTLKDLDITDEKKCEEVILRLKPALVINTAAYHRVDDCEDQDLEALRINAHGPRNVALACKKASSALVHISTDYVFSGNKKQPYSESDAPDPKTAYGISKLAGEQFVRYILPQHFIVRSSGLYGVTGCLGKGGGNFVENLIKRAEKGDQLRVVTDEILSPTYTLDLAEKIKELIETQHYGIYHIVNSGSCSWWEFTIKIFELLEKKNPVEKASGANFISKAIRPKYSVLQSNNLVKIGLSHLRPWEKALKAYLLEKGHINS